MLIVGKKCLHGMLNLIQSLHVQLGFPEIFSKAESIEADIT